MYGLRIETLKSLILTFTGMYTFKIFQAMVQCVFTNPITSQELHGVIRNEKDANAK